MNRKRLTLLRKLESIIGNECYNGSTQNWGPGGSFEGEGRDFRYPLTVLGEDGSKIKVKSGQPLSPGVAMTGYYAFGANQLHIMRALEQVLCYLETNNQLEV